MQDAQFWIATETDTPDEARSTLPILSMRDGHQVIVIGYHLGDATHKATRRIYFPFEQLVIPLPSGPFVLEDVEPDEFGIILPLDAFVGDLADLSRFSYQEYEKHVDAYVSIITRIADSGMFAAGDTESSHAKELAVELKAAYAQASESALEPYYTVVGRQMFQWLERTIGRESS
jgi:hypothetical protein